MNLKKNIIHQQQIFQKKSETHRRLTEAKLSIVKSKSKQTFEWFDKVKSGKQKAKAKDL